MAISKIHPIRHSVLDAINYITNPEKTDDELLISSFGCSPHTADIEFEQTASYGTKIGNVKAQHIIQSFAPGEISPKLAHEIGMKLAMRYTNGEHEFVLATHVDKDHIHNHIIFNSVSFTDYRKYRQNYTSFNKMRDINDELCASYGLSVIKDKERSAEPYYKYKDVRTNNSNRQVLKNTIDSYIPLVDSFDELIEMLKKTGYEIKITNDNYSIKKEGSQRYMRLKNLGDRYTMDAIITRIRYKDIDATPYIAPPRQEIGLLKDLSDRLDMIKSPAYQNKVALSEVKKIAATYNFLNTHGITSLSVIEEKQDEWSREIKNLRSSIRGYETQIAELKEIYESLERREKYRDVYAGYLNSGKSKQYEEEHSTGMMLFRSACTFLSSKGVDPSTKAADIKARLDELIQKKDALYDEYHKLNSDHKQLMTASKNIETLISRKEKNVTKHKENIIAR